MKKTIIIALTVLVVALSVFAVSDYNKKQALTTPPSSSTSEINPVTDASDSKDNTDSTETAKTENSEKVAAPDFKLKDLSGKEVSLSDFKGKRVFVNFWATWCPPCKAEMPELEKLYQETKTSDLVIIAVDLGEDKATVQKFIEKNKYNFQVLLDTNNEAASLYGIRSIPTSYFIDKDGYIVNGKIGAMNLEEMRSYVNSIPN
jgi:thiol-disulfide isomerase/thioredoxin